MKLLLLLLIIINKLCGRPPQYVPAPCKLTFDLLTSKVVSKSRVTWATSVPILVFLGLSVLDLGPTDRRQTHRRHTDVRRASSLNASALWERGIITELLQRHTVVTSEWIKRKCRRSTEWKHGIILNPPLVLLAIRVVIYAEQIS